MTENDDRREVLVNIVVSMPKINLMQNTEEKIYLHSRKKFIYRHVASTEWRERKKV